MSTLRKLSCALIAVAATLHNTHAVTMNPAQFEGCLYACEANREDRVQRSCGALAEASADDLRIIGSDWALARTESRCGSTQGEGRTIRAAQYSKLRNSRCGGRGEYASTFSNKISSVLTGANGACGVHYAQIERRTNSAVAASTPPSAPPQDVDTSPTGDDEPAPVVPPTVVPTPPPSVAVTPVEPAPVAAAPVAVTPVDRTSRNIAACNVLKASPVPNLGDKDPQLRSIGTAAQQSALPTLYAANGWTDSGRSRLCSQNAQFRNRFNRHGCGAAIGTGDNTFVPTEGLMAKVALSELLACQCAGQDRLAVRNYRREHGGNLSGIPAEIAPKSSQYGGRVRVSLPMNCSQITNPLVQELAGRGGSTRTCALQLNAAAGASAPSEILALANSDTACVSSGNRQTAPASSVAQ